MNEAVESANNVRIPKDAYRLRIMEEPVFKTSGSGNPMLVFKLEVVSPTHIEVDGQKVEIAGQEFTYYGTLHDNAARLKPLHKALGLGMELDIDESGKVAGVTYAGREVTAVCDSKEVPQLKEDKSTPLLDPATGKPLMRFQKNVQQFV